MEREVRVFYPTEGYEETLLVKVEPGEDLAEAIRRVAEQHQIIVVREVTE